MPTVRIAHHSQVADYFHQQGWNLKNSLPGLMRQAGRLCAVSLAHQTQPFGIDAKAEAIGKVATNRDIYLVYTTPGNAFEDLPTSIPRQSKKGKEIRFNPQQAFWSNVTRSQWARAQDILARFSKRFKTTPIMAFDGGARHRQLRNNRGRISKSQKPVMIVKNPQTLKGYVQIETNKVGAGKGGWATCARILGGVRGLPRWITKHDSPGTAIQNYGADRTSITMINQVPYASAILSPSQKAEAVRIAVERLFKSIQIAQRNRGRAVTLANA